MPIRPENRDRYPADWREIRNAVLERAGNRCEWCDIENHVTGFRDGDGRWWRRPNPLAPAERIREVTICLTIAHLDHVPENCDFDNLVALCQRCHNKYDLPERVRGIQERRTTARRQSDLFKREIE